MKFNIEESFYKKMNVFAKTPFFVGIWFIGIAFKIMGMGQKEK